MALVHGHIILNVRIQGSVSRKFPPPQKRGVQQEKETFPRTAEQRKQEVKIKAIEALVQTEVTRPGEFVHTGCHKYPNKKPEAQLQSFESGNEEQKNTHDWRRGVMFPGGIHSTITTASYIL